MSELLPLCSIQLIAEEQKGAWSQGVGRREDCRKESPFSQFCLIHAGTYITVTKGALSQAKPVRRQERHFRQITWT